MVHCHVSPVTALLLFGSTTALWANTVEAQADTQYGKGSNMNAAQGNDLAPTGPVGVVSQTTGYTTPSAAKITSLPTPSSNIFIRQEDEEDEDEDELKRVASVSTSAAAALASLSSSASLALASASAALTAASAASAAAVASALEVGRSSQAVISSSAAASASAAIARASMENAAVLASATSSAAAALAAQSSSLANSASMAVDAARAGVSTPVATASASSSSSASPTASASPSATATVNDPTLQPTSLLAGQVALIVVAAVIITAVVTLSGSYFFGRSRRRRSQAPPEKGDVVVRTRLSRRFFRAATPTRSESIYSNSSSEQGGGTDGNFFNRPYPYGGKRNTAPLPPGSRPLQKEELRGRSLTLGAMNNGREPLTSNPTGWDPNQPRNNLYSESGQNQEAALARQQSVSQESGMYGAYDERGYGRTSPEWHIGPVPPSARKASDAREAQYDSPTAFDWPPQSMARASQQMEMGMGMDAPRTPRTPKPATFSLFPKSTPATPQMPAPPRLSLSREDMQELRRRQLETIQNSTMRRTGSVDQTGQSGSGYNNYPVELPDTSPDGPMHRRWKSDAA